MAKKKDLIMLTYPGIVDNPKDTDTFILDELMRKFQSAKRYLRERKFEGKNRKEAVNLAKPLFIPNSRYMRDAFLEAEASISSQEELLPTYIAQNDIKIDKLEKQIENLTKSKKKKDIESLKYKQSKLAKLKKKNRFYQYHLDNGRTKSLRDGPKNFSLNKYKKQKKCAL